MTWIAEQDRTKVDAAITKLTPTQLENGRGEPSFALWLALVDNRIGRLIGLGHRDIADWTWYDGFESGMSPRDAAIEALQNDDTFSSLFDDQEV